MLDHVTIRVSERDASERFYTTVLATLGIEETYSGADEWDNFALYQATDEHPPTRGLHIGFRAPSRDHVDAFWHAGTEAGYRDDGAPGPRPQYNDSYYGGFLLDPDGNSAEAAHHGAMPEPAAMDYAIDHVWIRVADVAAAKRFYETIAPYASIELRHDDPRRVRFAAANGTLSLVSDERPVTQNVHVAFGARDNATVDAFHAAATAAGYADNGAPGERAVYHPGYYGAFVLDPDGNNIEVVCHNR